MMYKCSFTTIHLIYQLKYTLEITERPIKMDNPEKLATQGTQEEEDKTNTQLNICRTLKLLCELASNFAVIMLSELNMI
jgi:hypothetical protein